MTVSAPAIAVDVAGLIDSRPISALQIRAFVLCGLVAVLDGIDSQLIGIAGAPDGGGGRSFSRGVRACVFGHKLLSKPYRKVDLARRILETLTS